MNFEGGKVEGFTVQQQALINEGKAPTHVSIEIMAMHLTAILKALGGRAEAREFTPDVCLPAVGSHV